MNVFVLMTLMVLALVILTSAVLFVTNIVLLRRRKKRLSAEFSKLPDSDFINLYRRYRKQYLEYKPQSKFGKARKFFLKICLICGQKEVTRRDFMTQTWWENDFQKELIEASDEEVYKIFRNFWEKCNPANYANPHIALSEFSMVKQELLKRIAKNSGAIKLSDIVDFCRKNNDKVNIEIYRFALQNQIQ